MAGTHSSALLDVAIWIVAPGRTIGPTTSSRAELRREVEEEDRREAENARRRGCGVSARRPMVVAVPSEELELVLEVDGPGV